MSTGALDAPQDPAVRRLLPDASRDDVGRILFEHGDVGAGTRRLIK